MPAGEAAAPHPLASWLPGQSAHVWWQRAALLQLACLMSGLHTCEGSKFHELHVLSAWTLHCHCHCSRAHLRPLQTQTPPLVPAHRAHELIQHALSQVLAQAPGFDGAHLSLCSTIRADDHAIMGKEVRAQARHTNALHGMAVPNSLSLSVLTSPCVPSEK